MDKLEKIYYIAVDNDIYENELYIRTYSDEYGFWDHEPTFEEVESYLLNIHPHWEEKINNGKDTSMKKTSIVWDVLEWDRIG